MEKIINTWVLSQKKQNSLKKVIGGWTTDRHIYYFKNCRISCPVGMHYSNNWLNVFPSSGVGWKWELIATYKLNCIVNELLLKSAGVI